MKKILTVLGARPQFIKAAIISRVIYEQYHNNIQEIIVHTGQHYDVNMSDIFFKEMHIPQPNYRLNVGGKSNVEMTGQMLVELEKLMLQERPDIVLIYGDTNSTLAAAITASKVHIPIAHIEAGMRAFDKKVPEEVNRVLADHVSSYFFCTSEQPAQNLRKEGLNENIYVVGDVMYDLVLFYKDIAKSTVVVQNLPKQFYLATCHRQENTDNQGNLRSIFDALKELASKTPVVIPLHPRTKRYLLEYDIKTDGLHVLEPVGYFDMLYLLEHAQLVLTDSGGVQKEAYYCNKAVVVMRDNTEWRELIDNGIAALTGANKLKIIDAVKNLSNMSKFPKNIYGDGLASEKIVKILNSI